MVLEPTTSCLTVEDVTITMPLATRGDLCLVGNARSRAARTTVEVGENVTMTANNTSGARNPSAATGWTTSTNVYTSNNAYATASIGASAQSANLDSTGFGFTIPTGATIIGIEVDIERKASATSAIEDYDVYVLKGGSRHGHHRPRLHDRLDDLRRDAVLRELAATSGARPGR